jgi:hypothetical protein
VVDLKTGRTPPTGPAVERNLQLALYQYAVDAGAVDDLVPAAPASSGGAELVQLGVLDETVGVIVQPQAAHAAGSAARTALEAGLDATAAMVRSEVFPAVSGAHCDSCDFVPLCPIRSAGAVLGG